MSHNTIKHFVVERSGRRKGQFFLAGAIFIILLFYLGVSILFSPVQTTSEAEKNFVNLFENIKNEYPRAFNFGFYSSPIETLTNFTYFADNMTTSRGIDFKVFWAVTQNSDDDLNITIGNFLGYDTNVTLNVSGQTDVITVADGEIGSSLFTSPPSEFDLNLSFNKTEKNLILEKYKHNLYLILRMTKGEEIITGEIKS